MPPVVRRARRQNRRRAVATTAIAASAISSARTNRAVRKNLEAQNEVADQQPSNQVAPEEQNHVGNHKAINKTSKPN